VTTPPTLEEGTYATDPYDPAHRSLQALREGAKKDAEVNRAAKSFWRELPILILIALVLAVFIKTFIVQAFFIPSGSMLETLQVDDRVLVSKLSYVWGSPEHGDVVVFDDPRGVAGEEESVPARLWRNLAESIGIRTPQSEFIKRVIGVGGDTVEARDGTLYVNGEAIEEPYLPSYAFTSDFDLVEVPEGELFVMGDNRSDSVDSRSFGSIPADDVVGRAFIVMWPPSRWAGL
jgi:signal peptidase I